MRGSARQSEGLSSVLDQERLAIGKAMGLEIGTEIIDVFTQYQVEYHTTGESISDVVGRVPAYAAIYGPKTLKTRYIYEDVPMGLVPLVSLGKAVDQPVAKMELIIQLAEQLLGEDFTMSGRNSASLGLQGLSVSQIVRYAETGRKQV